MSESDRVLLQSLFVEERSPAEVAARLGITPGATTRGRTGPSSVFETHSKRGGEVVMDATSIGAGGTDAR